MKPIGKAQGKGAAAAALSFPSRLLNLIHVCLTMSAVRV